jgi:hypothetical protein
MSQQDGTMCGIVLFTTVSRRWFFVWYSCFYDSCGWFYVCYCSFYDSCGWFYAWYSCLTTVVDGTMYGRKSNYPKHRTNHDCRKNKYAKHRTIHD